MKARERRSRTKPPSSARVSTIRKSPTGIVGFDALPASPLPHLTSPPGGVLTGRQARARAARRALAAMGYAETAGWSFTARKAAELFDKACKGSNRAMLRVIHQSGPPCDRGQCGDQGPGLGVD